MLNVPMGPGPEQDFWVTPHDLELAANRTRTGASTVQDHLNMLRSYVLGLESFWTGSAQKQFMLLMHDFDVYSNMLIESLNNIASGMDGNRVNYESTEQANLRNLVTVDLPPVRF
jgi:WXG100 family type VII secretion target